MSKTLAVLITLTFMMPCGLAQTHAIGTASARGYFRVDDYMVIDNATLFDGSVVQTGGASAVLRLGTGTRITMAANSRGKLFGDRIVLQQGASELTASNPFQLQVHGLRVRPMEANSLGRVSLLAGNKVQVSVLRGGFGVTNGQGKLLATINPGLARAFTIQGGDASMAQSDGSKDFSDVGVLDRKNGRYYLTDAWGSTYELTGQDLDKYVGAKVVVLGTEVSGSKAEGIVAVISVNQISVNGPSNHSGKTKVIVSTALMGAGIGTAVGLYESNQGQPPASR